MNGNELEVLREGDRKQCPYCAETIRAEAIKCRWCGSLLEPRPGLSSFSQPWLRPRAERKIAGVCAGLADQFGVSVTILRLAFLLGFFFSGGIFLLVYLVLWIVMPDEDSAAPERAMTRDPFD